MDKSARTRDVFLSCMGIIYMFAFASLYTQIPGLFSSNGILPVHSLLKSIKEDNKGKPTEGLYMHTPTLLWFMPYDPAISMEILSFAGTCLSFGSLIFQSLRTTPVYFMLWLFYLSLYKVGETFLWFQWDILLLEVGFISIFVAPVSSRSFGTKKVGNIHKQIPFWLMKWLLFRLMFASGIVKLTSKCPTWWGLTALNYHYESQCIPTPLAWWAHQLPSVVQQLSVLGTYFIEILLPVFFFSPVRFLRLFAGYAQVLLMIVIALTGNYNFFNLLTAALCLSLVDDEHLDFVAHFFSCTSRKQKTSSVARSPSSHKLVWLINLAALCLTAYYCSSLVHYDKYFKLDFTHGHLDEFLKWVMPVITWTASILFAIKILFVLFMSIRDGVKSWIGNFIKVALVLVPSVFIFAISLVPFSTLDRGSASNLWPVVNKWHHTANKFELVHSYGLFRRMTGVGGRPEVILEGSDSPNGPWKEYEFVYKPGNPAAPLVWAAPHQPRLDWQLWFAALGSYQHNPWFISLVHRLLNGQTEVLDLIDRSRSPFERPPKYIRSSLYSYSYTKLKKDGGVPKAWWKRKFTKEYTPPLAKDDTAMLEFLKYNRLMPVKVKKQAPGRLESFFATLRTYTMKVHPPLLLWSLFFTAIFLSFLDTFIARLFQRKVKQA